MKPYETGNREKLIEWFWDQGEPRTMMEAVEAAEGGTLDVPITSVKGAISRACKSGVLGKVGSAYYPRRHPQTGNPVALRLVEVQPQ